MQGPTSLPGSPSSQDRTGAGSPRALQLRAPPVLLLNSDSRAGSTVSRGPASPASSTQHSHLLSQVSQIATKTDTDYNKSVVC